MNHDTIAAWQQADEQYQRANDALGAMINPLLDAIVAECGLQEAINFLFSLPECKARMAAYIRLTDSHATVPGVTARYPLPPNMEAACLLVAATSEARILALETMWQPYEEETFRILASEGVDAAEAYLAGTPQCPRRDTCHMRLAAARSLAGARPAWDISTPGESTAHCAKCGRELVEGAVRQGEHGAEQSLDCPGCGASYQ